MALTIATNNEHKKMEHLWLYPLLYSVKAKKTSLTLKDYFRKTTTNGWTGRLLSRTGSLSGHTSK
ncbi:hypothetical protein J6590_049339 [Homalodisca vitripennis]|nr:hypothetical protein J6590_049339 [Homalodisca vitripennis]